MHITLAVTLQRLTNALDNGPTNYAVSHHLDYVSRVIVVCGTALAELVALYGIVYGTGKLVLQVRNAPALFSAALRRFGIGEMEVAQTFLELRFPVGTTKSAYATEQLHIVLRELVGYSGFWDRLAAHKKPYSLELVSTNDEGVRYVLMTSAQAADTVWRDLASFLPGLQARIIDDYTSPLSDHDTEVAELRLRADFILPLQGHKALAEHDLMAYLTGHMAKLSPGELVAVQIVTVPVYRNTHHRVSRRQRHIEARIALGREVWSQLEPQRTPIQYSLWLLWYPPLWYLTRAGRSLAAIGGFIAGMVFGREERSSRASDKRRSDNPYDIEMAEVIKAKLDQPLFEVTIRILVSSPDEAVRSSRLHALIGSFSPFQNTYQSLAVRQHVSLFSPRDKNVEQFRRRQLAHHHVSQQTILSSSELSDLYHFPHTDTVKTEGFVKSRSRELAAPLSIRRTNAVLDVVVGVNTHGGETRPIGMTLEQRQKHTYVIGKTGTGKTTMLTSMIYQDMMSGKGLAVLDPHGDMFRELLAIVPEHRQDDVVIFDPHDRAYPPGLNMLDPGVEFADEDDQREWITSTVLTIFERLADEKQWGPRMEHILRNATMTALYVPNASLYTIQRLLTDKKYQREVAKTLKDPVLRQFWDKEFKLMGPMQMSSATAPLTHRLGHFITTKMSRHILLQDKSTLRIAEIMNEGKILLVNLSKGDIGEDQSFFFGTILSAFIWMAAYQRTQIPEKERKDFFLYVDEFQNFATKQFTDITSEGRKFHISLIASHQNIAQIEDKNILKVVAGNSHTLICLKASPDDEAFILPYMEPAVEKGDIVNLQPYHFYMKTTAEESEDAFSGSTTPLEVERDDTVAAEVLARSRKQYGTPKAKAEKHMDVLFAVPEKSSSETKPASKKGKPKEPEQGNSKEHGA